MTHDTPLHHDIPRHLSELAEEEHALERGLALPLEPHRLEDVTAELDQCWDLLRQRRGREQYGENPDRTSARDPSTVEGYLQ